MRDDLGRLRALAGFDSASALNKCRYISERVLRTLCDQTGTSWGKTEPTLENMLGPLVARGVIPKNIGVHLRTIQANASPGSHFQSEPLSDAHVFIAVVALLDVLEWYLRQRDPQARIEPAPGVFGPPLSTRSPTGRTGDRYLGRAIEEYDMFYGDKALTALRAALKVDPTHPRALAYVILFGGAPRTEQESAAKLLRSLAPSLDGPERTLAECAGAVVTAGPLAARKVLPAAVESPDPELSFWRAELAYRSGDMAEAELSFRAIADNPNVRFRGRLFDHLSAVLLLHHKTMEAEEVGRAFVEAFPAEAEALGVHATALAMAGRLEEALPAAEEAVALRDDEDTRAGLAKVLAMRGELEAAAAGYEKAIAVAPDARRALRRAALGMVRLLQGDRDAAAAAVEPCITGADAALPSLGAAHFVAALASPARLDDMLSRLSRLSSDAKRARASLERPEHIARLLKAARLVGAGAFASDFAAAEPTDAACEEARKLLVGPCELATIYHVPHAAPLAWLVAARAQRDGGATLRTALAAYPGSPHLLLALAEELASDDPAEAIALLEQIESVWATADEGVPVLLAASSLLDRLPR
jgi:tetratricopeptide (TPR) repeat protein